MCVMSIKVICQQVRDMSVGDVERELPDASLVPFSAACARRSSKLSLLKKRSSSSMESPRGSDMIPESLPFRPSLSAGVFETCSSAP